VLVIARGCVNATGAKAQFNGAGDHFSLHIQTLTYMAVWARALLKRRRTTAIGQALVVLTASQHRGWNIKQ
jgi:hypothetical protein